MSKRPAVDIEINFDPELEEFGINPEQADSRHVRVTIDERKIVPGSLSLGPPDPEDQVDSDFLVCPVKIRPNTPVYPADNRQIVEFQAELDTVAIFAAWGTVEDAAKKPRAFSVSVQVETSRPTGPREVKGRGRLKINLNSIRWTWQALIRDGKGVESPDGPEEENTPIRVKVDGTNSHGFRLTLQREVHQDDGTTKEEDADFTHYLSPNHKVDFSVLEMDPKPWDPDIQPTQEIVTTWWTKNLDDDSILSRLPIETTIRTQAFPPNSITKRVPNQYIPDDTPRLAIREIPLILGVAKWNVRVITPDPDDEPMLLEGEDLCIDAEIEIFDDLTPDTIRYMKNRQVQWSLRADANGQFPGTIDGQTSGTWTTDDQGHIKFHICIKRENSVFLVVTPGRYFAEFDLFEPGPDVTKPGPKIRSSDTPEDDKPPSFVLDWAPLFDLQLFKLPYFTEEPTLDPNNLPTEDTVQPIDLILDADQETSYRNIFRTGRTVTLKPVVVGRAPAGGEPVEYDLLDYRLIVGANSQADQSAKRQILVVAPPLPDGTNGPPFSVTIPASPRGKGTAAAQLTIKQEVKVHPDMIQLLDTVVDESGRLEDATRFSSALTGAAASSPLTEAPMNFHELAVTFYNKAIEHFAKKPQKELVEKVAALMNTLSELARYLPFTAKCWERAGKAIQLHRQSFQRMLDNMLNFFYDFLLWGKVKDWLTKKFPRLSSGLDQINPSVWVERGSRWLWARAARSFIGQRVLPIIEKYQNKIEQAATTAESVLDQAAQKQATAVAELSHARDVVAASNQEFSQKTEAWVDALEKLESARARYGPGPHPVGPQNLHPDDLLATLEARVQAAGGELIQTRVRLAADLRVHADKLKRRVMAECEVQNATARKAALDSLLVEANDHKARITEITTGLDDSEASLDDLEVKLKALGTTLDVTKATEPPEIRSSLSQAFTSLEQQVQTNIQPWTEAAASQAYLLQQVQQRGGAPGVASPTMAGAFTSLTAGAREAQTEIEKGLDSIQNVHVQARGLMERRVQSAAALWVSERALYAEARSDAVKSGQQFLVETAKGAIDDKQAPPSSQGESDEGYIHQFWNGFLALLGKIIEFLDSCTFGLVSAFLGVMKKLLHILLGVLSFLLRLTARVGIKLMEAILAVLDYLRTGWRRASAFQDKARDAGFASLAASGGDGDRLFEFSYIKEIKIGNRFKEACHQAETTKEGVFGEVDQILDTEMRAGYEDSYPDMMRGVRRAFYGMCARIMDGSTLSNPPCDVDRSDAARFVAVGGQKLDNDIQEYLNAFNLANADQDSWGASFLTLFEASGSNLRVIEGRIEWVGWITTWGCRVLAVVCAVGGWWTGVGFAAAFALVETAQVSDAVTALCRLVLHAWSCHLYATIYPRDAALLPAIAYAAVFEPTGQRFDPASPEDIAAGYRKPPPTQ